MSATHLISRRLDPLFALFIGVAAAAMRINREEKEMGRSTAETADAGIRRMKNLLPFAFGAASEGAGSRGGEMPKTAAAAAAVASARGGGDVEESTRKR